MSAVSGVVRAFWPTSANGIDAATVVDGLTHVFAGLADADPDAFGGPWFWPMRNPSREGRSEAPVDLIGTRAVLDAQSSAGWATSGDGAMLHLWRTSADGTDLDVTASIGSSSPYIRNHFVLAVPPPTIADAARCQRVADVLAAMWPAATIDALDRDRTPIVLSSRTL